ncbi:MAG TPA: hypothetical protein VGG28_01760 [Kofleriaceae bacterium]|jgi:hypothetical protein
MASVALFGTTLALLDAWSVLAVFRRRDPDRIVLRKQALRQLSELELPKVPSFEELRTLRVAAERKTFKDGFIAVIEPKNQTPYSLIYSGGDNATHRLFACYVGAIESLVLTVYVEALRYFANTLVGALQKGAVALD